MAKVEPFPCPFCGEVPEVYRTAYGEIAVQCMNIRCLVVSRATAKTRAAAVKKWNTRSKS